MVSVVSSMITVKHTVMRDTPESTATAPMSAYVPGSMTCIGVSSSCGAGPQDRPSARGASQQLGIEDGCCADRTCSPTTRPRAEPMRMHGTKRPEGTQMP